MSADNWRECPKCSDNQKSDRQLALDKLAESYGTLPLDQWLEEHKEAMSMPETRCPVEDFREDYEFYWEDYLEDSTTVVASYSGCCATCGFKISFKYKHPVDLTA